MKHRAAIALLSFALGCGISSRVQIDGQTCTYKDKVYQDQQQWKDDCNTCTCDKTTGVSCTREECLPTDDDSCVYKGRVYQHMEEWKDDCNSCICDGGFQCTSMLCHDDRICTYKGKVYLDQQQWKDDCNTCTCNPDGSTGVSCTTLDCDADTLCGGTQCDAGQICVHPCCGGPPAGCIEKPADGVCPSGYLEGCFNGMDGCEAEPCMPDAPYCVDEVPSHCELDGLQAHCVCA